MQYSINQRKGFFDYHETLKEAMNILKFKNEPLNLWGSSNLRALQYFGDYDFMTNILSKYSARESYTEFKRILDESEKSGFLTLIEIKIQLKNGVKIRELVQEDEFIKNYKKIEFIKFDFIIYIDYIFYELSSLYSYDNKLFDKNNNIKRLNDEIQELKKDNNYYKILKRTFSLANLKNEKLNAQELIKFFNKVGSKYRIISNLEAIEKIYEVSDSKLDLYRIKENLKILGISEKDMSNKINILRDSIQKEAEDFYIKNI